MYCGQKNMASHAPLHATRRPAVVHGWITDAQSGIAQLFGRSPITLIHEPRDRAPDGGPAGGSAFFPRQPPFPGPTTPIANNGCLSRHVAARQQMCRPVRVTPLRARTSTDELRNFVTFVLALWRSRSPDPHVGSAKPHRLRILAK